MAPPVEPIEERKVRIIDNTRECAKCVSELLSDGEPIAVDAEGINLCRDGELCLLQVAPRSGAILLFDIAKLGQEAFNTGRLKELLESPSLVKLWYDCRADADALFHQFGVLPKNVYDVQVSYCEYQDENNDSKDPWLKSLAHAIEYCSSQKCIWKKHVASFYQWSRVFHV